MKTEKPLSNDIYMIARNMKLGKYKILPIIRNAYSEVGMILKALRLNGSKEIK